jgi:hypothetical protein
MTLPIPEFARRMAVSAGCPDEQIDELWSDHVDFCDANRSDYGGGRWKKLVEAHVKSPRAPLISREDPIAVAARRAELEAKALEDAEYRKGAVSLTDWIADLRVKQDFFEALTPIERHIASYREPYPGERPEAWLMAATIDAPRMPRVGVKPRRVER